MLADISGYTRFLIAHKNDAGSGAGNRRKRVNQEHAEAIISLLLETVISGLEDVLVVNKLEGDAALFYGLSDEPRASAEMLVPRLIDVFGLFNAKLESLKECDGCFCDACCQRGDLRIKLVAHYGDFMIKQVRHFEELAGESVILAHRLLKNAVSSREYLLITDAFGQLMGSASGWEQRDEQVADFGLQAVRVLYPAEPQVKVRGWRPPWPWETISMYRFFREPRSRSLLEGRYRRVLAGIAPGQSLDRDSGGEPRGL